MAVVGPPPQSGLTGYPPKMHIAKGGPGPGSTGAQNPVTGLRQVQTGYTGATIAWLASPGATSYSVTSDRKSVV